MADVFTKDEKYDDWTWDCPNCGATADFDVDECPLCKQLRPDDYVQDEDLDYLY